MSNLPIPSVICPHVYCEWRKLGPSGECLNNKYLPLSPLRWGICPTVTPTNDLQPSHYSQQLCDACLE